MKKLHALSMILSALLLFSCSSSKKTSDATSETANAANPMVGGWTLESGSGTLQFMANGDVMFDQGDLIAAINRFQNTNRTQYTSRLVKSGRYTYDTAGQLTLNVMADWTGKGTGARRPADKSVASTIVFAIESMEGDTLKLRKMSMTQAGSDTENTNADEELTLTLKRKP